MFHIVFKDIQDWERGNGDRSIAARLLYAHLGIKDRDENRVSWAQFCTEHSLEHSTDVTLNKVVDVILPPNKCESKRRVIVVNIDEVYGMMDNDTDRTHLKNVLHALVASAEFCYFCILLTSTHALKVLQLSSFSQIDHDSITLPLLAVSHMHEVVRQVANRCLSGERQRLEEDEKKEAIPFEAVQRGYADLVLLESRVKDVAAGGPETAPKYFTYLLEMLTGVPRFLEKLLFEMGRNKTKFCRRSFLLNLTRVNDPGYVFDELLPAVVGAITAKYSRFKDFLSSYPIFPLLCTCSLFGAVFSRSDVLDWEDEHGRLHQEELTALEDSGIIFLADPPEAPETPLTGRDTPFALPTTRPTLTEQSGLSLMRVWRQLAPTSAPTPAPNTKREQQQPSINKSYCIVVPFIWMHLMVAQCRKKGGGLLQHIQLLTHLGTTLSPSEKERVTLSVIALRIYFLAHCGRAGTGELMIINVYDLFPVPAGRKVVPFLITVPKDFIWAVRKALGGFITQDNISALINAQPHARYLFWQNMDMAPSADSFVLTTPILAIQDKQSHSEKERRKTHSPASIASEHSKFSPDYPHLFVFATDKRVADNRHKKIAENELVISQHNESLLYGQYLSRIKSCRTKHEDVVEMDWRASVDKHMDACIEGQRWQAAVATTPSSSSSSSSSSTGSSSVGGRGDEDKRKRVDDVAVEEDEGEKVERAGKEEKDNKKQRVKWWNSCQA